MNKQVAMVLEVERAIRRQFQYNLRRYVPQDIYSVTLGFEDAEGTDENYTLKSFKYQSLDGTEGVVQDIYEPPESFRLALSYCRGASEALAMCDGGKDDWEIVTHGFCNTGELL